ncbi:tripartite tricarboxylate transporter substrate-binding protein [Humitalea sp. 24SJ18S-53]|uniref:tripartite tricarboxylate transporter substrate-binding protein n=1 Tax=Humitalea sp. 24SJ18S-53 TaxID=3422307 RepID=UPI003D6757EE
MPNTPRRAFLAGSALALAAPAIAQAQRAWPDGPIRLVAPFPPGGSVDLMCRLLQNPLQALLGVPVVVENRAGASGSLGTAIAARAPADGQTFVMVFDTHVVNPVLIPTLGYDPAKDLKAVMLVASAPMLVTTSATARQWTGLGPVIERARQAPETITYGTVGAGSLAHLTMERVQEVTGTKMVHVPYRGGGPLSTAGSTGEIDLAIASVVGLGGLVGTTLRALAQTGAERSPLRPAIPTLIESGVPGVFAQAFWGLLAPAGVPQPIMDRFHAALAEAIRLPAVRQPLEMQGVDVVGSTPAAFESFLTEQTATWTRVVRDNNITVN